MIPYRVIEPEVNTSPFSVYLLNIVGIRFWTSVTFGDGAVCQVQTVHLREYDPQEKNNTRFNASKLPTPHPHGPSFSSDFPSISQKMIPRYPKVGLFFCILLVAHIFGRVSQK